MFAGSPLSPDASLTERAADTLPPDDQPDLLEHLQSTDNNEKVAKVADRKEDCTDAASVSSDDSFHSTLESLEEDDLRVRDPPDNSVVSTPTLPVICTQTVCL